MLGIGVTSGGTRTNYALTRGEGALEVSRNETGASIADARSRESIAQVGEWIADVVTSQDDDELCVWIGAAGFSASTARGIAERLGPSMRALGRHMEDTDRQCEVFISNDAVALLKAPPLLGAGVVAIVGTGSVVMGAHPACPEGVVKRGGYEWLVSDEGSGVWMTLESIRLVLADIEARGPQDYHSALLDRLADHVGVNESELAEIAASHVALAKADLVARRMAESRMDTKRFFGRFVYPHIFDLASLEPGKPHDPIASEVLNRSVAHIVDSARTVSDILAAHTADEPNLREKLPLIVGGNIAANPLYNQRLRAVVSSECRSISSVDAIGDPSDALAALSYQYLQSDHRERRRISKSIDPLHPVLKLL